jgi:hypothetical protein
MIAETGFSRFIGCGKEEVGLTAKWIKRAGGGLAAAGALALVLNLAANRRSDAFTDYQGPDDPAAFKQDVAALSKDNTLFVVYHKDECPFCQKALKNLKTVRGESPIDYDVLKVEVDRYPRISRANMYGNGVPEAHVYFGAEEPFVLGNKTPSGNTGLILQDQDTLLKFLNALDQWKTINASPQSERMSPPLPAAPKK